MAKKTELTAADVIVGVQIKAPYTWGEDEQDPLRLLMFQVLGDPNELARGLERRSLDGEAGKTLKTTLTPPAPKPRRMPKGPPTIPNGDRGTVERKLASALGNGDLTLGYARLFTEPADLVERLCERLRQGEDCAQEISAMQARAAAATAHH